MALIDSKGSHGAQPRSSLLLLEDDDALRQMLRWELAELGYGVTAVGSCHEARSAATIGDFDLALFDIGLPDGNGAELASELFKQRPDMRIVLCSGQPSQPVSEHLPSSVIACLAKPVSIRDLDSLFRRQLGLSS